jgi:hypothetical protein
VIDHAGWLVLNAEADPRRVKWSSEKALSVRHSPRLAHRLGINSFFCRLKRTERSSADYKLAEWWSERRCAKECGRIVYPDGFGA